MPGIGGFLQVILDELLRLRVSLRAWDCARNEPAGPFCAGTPRSSGPLIHSLLPASHGSLPVFGKLFARKSKRLGSGDFGFALPGMLAILPTLNPSSPAKVHGRADESAQSCDRGPRAGDGAGSLSERGRGAVGVAGAAAGGPAAAG